jgi:hypothetical protein
MVVEIGWDMRGMRVEKRVIAGVPADWTMGITGRTP